MTQRQGRHRRRGAGGAVALFAGSVVLAVLAWWAVPMLGFRDRRECQKAADAAALAAAAAWLDDRILHDASPQLTRELSARCVKAADRFATANLAANGGAGECELECRRARPEGSWHGSALAIDLFECTVRSPGAKAVGQARALLDGRVCGFRPAPGHPSPVMPLALACDPAGADPDSWERQCERGEHGPGEFVGRLGKNLHPLAWRAELPSSLAGLRCEDLPAGCQELRVDGPEGLQAFVGESDPAALVEALQRLAAGRPAFAWPLAVPAGERGLKVVRFVAARLLAAQSAADGGVAVRLSPCLLSAPTAVVAEGAQPNPYLRKIRLVH